MATGMAYPRLTTVFNNWTRFTFSPEGAAFGEPTHGFHCANTLLLSHYRMTINGSDRYHRFSAQASATDWLMVGTLPFKGGAGNLPGGTIPTGGVDVSVRRRVDGGMTEFVRLFNNDGRKAHPIHLCFELAAPIIDDEFDLEIKNDQRQKPLSRLVRSKKIKNGLELVFQHEFGQSYLSSKKIVRGLNLRFQIFSAGHHRFTLHRHNGKIQVHLKTSLPPHSELNMKVFFDARVDDQKILAPKNEPPLEFPQDWESASDSGVKCDSSNSYLNLIFARAITDLATLKLRNLDHRRSKTFAVIAGIPRYVGIFGRDSLITGWQGAAFDPEFLKDTIVTIGRLQGKKYDPFRDEEPGRLLHERRLDPRSLTGEQNRDAYYGDDTSTPFYCLALNDHFQWHGDLKFVRSQKSVLKKCCQWILRKMEEGNGFVYYQPALSSAAGANRNQAWKDSGDAIVDDEGKICLPPLALVEIQGYCYEALICSSGLFKRLGEKEFAAKLEDCARKLKTRFNKKFWRPQKNIFALALRQDGSSIDCKASNIGHCLGGGIIDENKIAKVVRFLMSDEMFSGWGIRTLSRDNPAYDPFSYHRGSVWPVENGEMAARLSEIGKPKEAERIITAQLRLATLFSEFRLPEVVSGHEKSHPFPVPGLYPDANLIQAWSASATLQMVQTICGLKPDAPHRRLIIQPAFPEWLEWLRLENLCFCGGQVSFEIRRLAQGQHAVRVIKKSKKLKIKVLS